MGNKQSQNRSNIVDCSDLQVGDILLFTEKGGKFLYNVRYCRWISYTFAAFVIDNKDGRVRLCGHFPASSGPRGVHPVSVQALDAQLASGAYDAVYVRRLLHRPTPAAVDSIRAYAKSAASHSVEGSSFAQEADPLAGHKPPVDMHHSDEEVAILMELPSRRNGAFDRLKDCAAPVERFTTSRLMAEMLKRSGQVTGEGHIFSACTSDERLLASVCELELDKRAAYMSGRIMRGVVPGTLVTPEPMPFSQSLAA
eukprot:jgi/Ulvmu1/7863/UM004_0094.1